MDRVLALTQIFVQGSKLRLTRTSLRNMLDLRYIDDRAPHTGRNLNPLTLENVKEEKRTSVRLSGKEKQS